MQFTPKRLRKIKKIRQQTRRNLRHRVFKKIRKRRRRHSFRRKRKLNLRRRTLRVQRGGNGKNIARDANQRKAERGRMRGQLLAAEAQKEVVKFLQKDWMASSSLAVKSGRSETGHTLSIQNARIHQLGTPGWWGPYLRDYSPLGVLPFRPVGPWSFARLLLLVVEDYRAMPLSQLKGATVRWNGYQPSSIKNTGTTVNAQGKILQSFRYSIPTTAIPPTAAARPPLRYLMLMVQVDKPFTGTSGQNFKGGPPLTRYPLGARLALIANAAPGGGTIASMTPIKTASQVKEMLRGWASNVGGLGPAPAGGHPAPRRPIKLYGERSYVKITLKNGTVLVRNPGTQPRPADILPSGVVLQHAQGPAAAPGHRQLVHITEASQLSTGAILIWPRQGGEQLLALRRAGNASIMPIGSLR